MDIKNFVFENITKHFWKLISFILIVILYTSVFRMFDHDEFAVIHTSWKILHGEKIYVDFFHHHHALLYYLLTPFIAIFGENTYTIIFLRVSFFCIFLLILKMTYLISIKFFNKITGILSTLLLSSSIIFIAKGIEIRPDVPQTLTLLISIYNLLLYFENKSKKRLGLSAIFLGISFLLLQKTIFSVIIIVLLLCINICKKNIHFQDLLIYMSIFSLTLLPYLLYLFYNNSFYAYFTFCWLININSLRKFSPYPMFVEIILTNIFITIFYILGLSRFLKTSNQVNLGIISVGLLTSIFFIPTPFHQYVIPAYPFIVSISAHATYIMLNKYPRIISISVTLTLLILTLPHYLYRMRVEFF